MTHIEQRYSTAAEWAADNPTLHVGEVGWATDLLKCKLGDGFSPWNDLTYTTAEVTVTAADVGLDQVDNVRDIDKVVSSATEAALSDLDFDIRTDLAPKASPVFTGNPTAPTPAPGDNDVSLATTAFVKAAIDDAIAAFRLAQNPIGRILFNTTNVNPGTYMPGTTWVAWGSGRVPVGVDAAQTEFDTAEEVGGSKTVTLTAANLPAHVHPAGPSRQFMVNDTGSGANRANGGDVNMLGQTNTGSNTTTNDPVNNLPPYITCYMFKRTA